MNNVIEREGRYFVQCADGELEITAEQVRAREKMSLLSQKVLEEAKRMHRDQVQPRTFYPPVAYAAFKIERLEPLHEQLTALIASPEYNAEYLALWYSSLETQIDSLKEARRLPQADKEFIGFQIQGLKSCISNAKRLEGIRGRRTAISETTNKPNQPANMTMTPATLRSLYLELLQHPALADELTNYQKSKLREYAEGEKGAANESAVFLMDKYPNYNYPEQYRNGREFNYWQEKVPAYQDSQRVLQLLSISAVRPINAPAAVTVPVPEGPELSLRQVALLYIFTGKGAIKKDVRANEIARQYGHKSGAKLYDHYRKLSKPTGITGLEGAELPKAVEAIEGLLSYLSEPHLTKAKTALQTLKVKQQ